MPTENLLIYLVVGAILFVKFVFDAVQRWRQIQTAQQAYEPDEREPGAHEWESLRDAARGGAGIDEASSRVAPPPRVVPPPRTPERSASRPAHPSKAQSAARRRPPVRVEPA